MKNTFIIALLVALLQSCVTKKENTALDPVNWESRYVKNMPSDSLHFGSSYLSVYSEIYSLSEQLTHDLTSTVSLRNVNTADTIYIKKAEYFDTHGQLIRTYFDRPIFIAPMETVEIVIDEVDRGGGTGGNFLFQWSCLPASNEPFFEAVMISTSGQQGLSFRTEGKTLK